jgi:hypothetical protein
MSPLQFSEKEFREWKKRLERIKAKQAAPAKVTTVKKAKGRK